MTNEELVDAALRDTSRILEWIEAQRSAKAPEEPLAPGLRKVYFVQESGMGAIKIGTSKRVWLRVRDLQASTPYTMTLLAVMSGNKSVESVVHYRFAHARIRGEWFRPVPELLEYIAGLAPP